MFERFSDFLLISCQWIFRFIVTNILWIIYILLGGIVFGVFPATASLFAIVRRWKKRTGSFNIWKYYHEYYKKNFWKINKLGYIYFSIGVIILLALLLTVNHSHILINIIYSFLLFLFALYLLSVFYFFTVFVHFELTFKDYIIHPLYLMLFSFKQNILLIIGLVFIFYMFLQIPLIIPLFLGTAPAYWVMNVLLKHYQKLEERTKQS